MAVRHTREPDRFSDSQYGAFAVSVTTFLESDYSLPHRPDHLVASQKTLQVDFNVKYDLYNASDKERDEANKAYLAVIKALIKLINWAKSALPSLTPGSEEILLPFGLDEPTPRVYSEIKNYADRVDAHWQTVRDEPLFAVVKSGMDEFKKLRDDYDKTFVEQDLAQTKVHALQNDMDDAREAHHDVERAIFNWYRGFYQSGQEEWWTESPWGKTPGGDGKLAAPTKLMYDQFRNDFTWNPVEKATGYELEIFNIATQEKVTIETELNQKRVPLLKGEYIAKVRAVKKASDAEYSKWSSDVALTIAEAPGHFKYNPGQHEFSWDSVAGANMYELQKEGSFAAVYLGPDTEFVIELDPGQYRFRVRAGNEIEHWWGQWTEWLVVDI